MTTFLTRNYELLFTELADHRVKEWFGFSSPLVALTIAAIYLLSIYVLLPAFMHNRKPYSLKTFLYCYNIFQIVYCLTVVYGIVASNCTWRCQPVDYSSSPKALASLSWIYYTYILKGIELTETAVFILRKKYNQVSNLHVYHHVSTFLLAWFAVKYVGGGMVTFPIALNSAIHVLMYTYYLLASLGPEWQKKTMRWKARLTMFQMVQFCVLIVHSLQVVHPGCGIQKELLLIYLPDVILVFYMFGKFYQENYKKGL